MITFTMNNLYITKIIVRPKNGISNYEQSNSKFENFHNYFRAKQMSLRSFLVKKVIIFSVDMQHLFML